MTERNRELIRRAYAAFNARDIDAVLATFHADIHWPNGWEGGYVDGHAQVRDYWTRQWRELDPAVEPVGFRERDDGRLEVEVHQVVKDRGGAVLFDGAVRHVYAFRDGLILSMEIEKA
jgi:ketosteroid isomerase-like protein